jgi:hypothetical protein
MAKVENLHALVRRDEEVLRLQVAVDNPFLMGSRQTVRDLDGYSTALRAGSGSAHRSRNVSPWSNSETM